MTTWSSILNDMQKLHQNVLQKVLPHNRRWSEDTLMVIYKSLQIGLVKQPDDSWSQICLLQFMSTHSLQNLFQKLCTFTHMFPQNGRGQRHGAFSKCMGIFAYSQQTFNCNRPEFMLYWNGDIKCAEKSDWLAFEFHLAKAVSRSWQNKHKKRFIQVSRQSEKLIFHCLENQDHFVLHLSVK